MPVSINHSSFFTIGKKHGLFSTPVFQYSIAILCGLMLGYQLIPASFAAIVYTSLAIVIFITALLNKIEFVLCALPYLIYTEMFVRDRVPQMPYLFMSYYYIALFLTLILLRINSLKFYSRAFILLGCFALLESVDSIRTGDAVYAWVLTANIISLALITIWASTYIISEIMLGRILYHLKIAGTVLCGIMLASHITGDIEYSLVSNSTAVNGLAPVQVSGYTGFTAALFFLSMFYYKCRAEFIVNIILFILTVILLGLSFSRGGLYFLAAFMLLFFWFNRHKIKSYLFLLLLIPLAFIIAFYLTNATGGLIEERYNEEGSSGRDELIAAGIHLFTNHPFTGIGTANYNKEILKEGLYPVASGAHNEFVRVAAEHGIAGIILYWGFFCFLFFEIWGRGNLRKEYGTYFLVFFCMIAVHNALKISLQPYLILLAIATPSYSFLHSKKKLLVNYK